MKKYILRQELLHFGEKMKRFGAVAITLIFLASLIMIIPQTTSGITAESGKSVPVTLYFHDSDRMDTFVPTEPEENTSYAVLNDGDSVPFKTESLEKSLTIDTTIKPILSYHISIRVNQAVNIKLMVNLTFSFGDSTSRATGTKSHSVSGTGVLQLEDDTSVELDFDPDWSGIIQTGHLQSEISSAVTTTATGTPSYSGSYNVSMAYDSTQYPSNLSFRCNPVNTTIRTYDADTGEVKTEFEPNIIPSKALIRFKGIIQSAFGDGDIDYVHLKITGPQGFSNNTNLTSELGIRADSYDYSWNYSKYGSNLKADTYVANLTVKTVQNVFYQSVNFSFSAYGVYCSIDKTSALVNPGETASCYIEVINTGAVTDSMDITIDQYPSPSLPAWNISTGSHTTPSLSPGGKHPINLYVTPPGNLTSGSCYVRITATSSDLTKFMTVSFTVQIVKPYEVNLTWTQEYPPNYPAVSGYMYKFGILVRNKGGTSDTFTLKCAPAAGWNIGWEYNPPFEPVAGEAYTIQCVMARYGASGSSAMINLTVNATQYAVKDIVVNITGESEGAATTGNGTRYSNLTLSLTRLLGIDIAVEPLLKTVYVKNSDDSADYTITVTTSDETGYTVGLNISKSAGIKSAVFDNGLSYKQISVSEGNPGSETLTVTLAKGTAYGSYIATVEATIAGMPAYKKSIPTTTTAARYDGVNMTTESELVCTAVTGEQIEYILRVKNTGNDNASITLEFTKGSELCVLSGTPGTLGPGKERNITLTITIPSDAKDGQEITVTIVATSGSEIKQLTFEITVEKTGWGELIDILYDMSHFLILLIAVIVVFVALWIKRRR